MASKHNSRKKDLRYFNSMFVQLLFLMRAMDIRTLSIVRHNLILSTRKTAKVGLLVIAIFTL